MQQNPHTSDIISKLKSIKDAQGLSYQQIYEMLETANFHVSINSIKKVFSDGSECERFNYKETIEPISRVLFGIYGEKMEDFEIASLRSEIKLKNEIIARKDKEIEMSICEQKRQTEFFMKQIELKDERIDKLLDHIDMLLKQVNGFVGKCEKCTLLLTGNKKVNKDDM